MSVMLFQNIWLDSGLGFKFGFLHLVCSFCVVCVQCVGVCCFLPCLCVHPEEAVVEDEFCIHREGYIDSLLFHNMSVFYNYCDLPLKNWRLWMSIYMACLRYIQIKMSCQKSADSMWHIDMVGVDVIAEEKRNLLWRGGLRYRHWGTSTSHM